MELMFVHSRFKEKIILPKEFIQKIPKNIGLFATVQFIDQIDDLKKQLKPKNVIVFKTKHTLIPGQLLGCNIEVFSGVRGFVYIGDGLFHPKAILMKNNKPVYCYDPINKIQMVIDEKDVQKIQKRQKGAMLKFLTSSEIGVLVTLKHGQNFYIKAKQLKKKYPEKNFYFLVFDTIDFSQLENFNFIECFVNSACPRIGLDDATEQSMNFINLSKIL